MAHIGLLQAMEEAGIRPHAISGSSAGALVGALYAGGYGTEDILQFFKTTPLFSFSFFSPSKPGLLDSARYSIFLERYFPDNNFAELQLPLYIITTDLEEGEWVVHQHGPLFEPLLASASLPPIFTPVEIDGRQHADGGIMNNFPVEPLQQGFDLLIGSHVTPIERLSAQRISNSMQLLNRAQTLSWQAVNLQRLQLVDLLFEPPGITRISTFDTRAIERAYQLGYQHAKAMLPALIQLASRENGAHGSSILPKNTAQHRAGAA